LATSIFVDGCWWQLRDIGDRFEILATDFHKKKSPTRRYHQHHCGHLISVRFGKVLANKAGFILDTLKNYLESLFIRLSKTIFFAWFFEFFAIHSCSLKIFSFTNRSFSYKYHQIIIYTLLTIFEIRWRIGHHIYHRKRSVQKQRSGTLFQTEKIKLFRCPYIFSIFKQIFFFWMKQKWNLPKQI